MHYIFAVIYKTLCMLKGRAHKIMCFFHIRLLHKSLASSYSNFFIWNPNFRVRSTFMHVNCTLFALLVKKIANKTTLDPYFGRTLVLKINIWLNVDFRKKTNVLCLTINRIFQVNIISEVVF